MTTTVPVPLPTTEAIPVTELSPLPQPDPGLINDDELVGVIDLHIHAAPDVRERKATMLEVARAAAAAGMQAIVFKSHHEHTAAHATMVRSLVLGIEVFGGVVLNRYVGGLNPDAVEAAAALGARLVWMPTFTAAHHLRMHGEPTERGVSVLDPDDPSRLSLDANAVLEVVAARGLALCSGHLAPEETVLLFEEALRRGVHAAVVNHPDMSFVGFPVALQQQLARLDGVFFERCYNSTMGVSGHGKLEQIVAEINAVGVETTILASDLGQPENPFPTEGLRDYHRALRAQGFTDQQMDRMARTNPARVLRLSR